MRYEMLRREQVIGIISSWDIRRNESEGYSLLFTDERVVGAHRPDFPQDFWAYLGPGSSASEELRKRADAKAIEIISGKDFELQKDKVVKVIYDEPRTYVGGRLLFIHTGPRVEVKVTLISPFNAGIGPTLDTLTRSLQAFVPNRLYAEGSGERIGPRA